MVQKKVKKNMMQEWEYYKPIYSEDFEHLLWLKECFLPITHLSIAF